MRVTEALFCGEVHRWRSCWTCLSAASQGDTDPCPSAAIRTIISRSFRPLRATSDEALSTGGLTQAAQGIADFVASGGIERATALEIGGGVGQLQVEPQRTGRYGAPMCPIAVFLSSADSGGSGLCCCLVPSGQVALRRACASSGRTRSGWLHLVRATAACASRSPRTSPGSSLTSSLS